MEINRDNRTKLDTDPRHISVGWGIVIASIIIVVGFVSVQVLEQKSIEDQSIRNQVYKESISDPYADCLELAKNRYERTLSSIRAMNDGEFSQCAAGTRCVRSNDEIMADFRRSVATLDRDLAVEEERCVNLYK